MRPAATLLAVLIAAAGIITERSAAMPRGPRPLLPELAEAAPAQLAVQTVRVGSALDYRLDFASLAVNIGRGPLLVEASRRPGAETMSAHQVVLQSDGSTRRGGFAGLLTYDRGPGHDHWHLQDFERYELRSLDGRLVRRVRKAGFCLGDRVRAGRRPVGSAPRVPAWHTLCGAGRPGLTSLREGISVGYGDVYPPEVDGQYVELGDLAPGRYVLVNQADPDHRLRVLARGHDLAWTLIELSAKRDAFGAPGLRILASCDGRFHVCTMADGWVWRIDGSAGRFPRGRRKSAP